MKRFSLYAIAALIALLPIINVQATNKVEDKSNVLTLANGDKFLITAFPGGAGSLKNINWSDIRTEMLADTNWQNIPSSMATAGNFAAAGSVSGSNFVGSGSLNYSLNLVDSHISWLGTGDSLVTAISNATDGDTIMLPSGTMTISSALTVNKALKFVGEGSGASLTCSHTNDNCIVISNSNVSFENVSVTQTLATASKAAFRIDGTAGSVLTGIFFRNVTCKVTASTSTDRCLIVADASADLLNWQANLTVTTTTTNNGYSTLVIGASTTEAAMTVNFYNSFSTVTSALGAGTRVTLGLYVLDSTSASAVNVNAYNSRFVSTDTNGTSSIGIRSDGANAIFNGYNSVAKGSVVDASLINGATLNLKNFNLENGTSFGTPIGVGTMAAGKFQAAGNVGISTTAPTTCGCKQYTGGICTTVGTCS